MATNLELLRQEQAKLIAQGESLDREYGSGRGGKEFLTGDALQNWERQVQENENARRSIAQQIRAETRQLSAAGQTAQQKLENESTPNNPGTGTPDPTQDPQPVTAEQKEKIAQAESGELSNTVQQSQDPTATNKQNSTNGTEKKESEANFANETSNNTSSSVTGKDVSGKTSDYESIPLMSGNQLPKNKLHDYTSYTYRITLFLLTVKDYNNLASSPSTFVPTFSLISSGGGFASPGSIETETTRKTTPWGGYEDISTTQTKSGRHPDFQTDFFIDNLSLTTIVGLNAKSKASNAVNISFNITEPYGLSLLDRLLSACETSGDRNPNYMEQPYLLQIDLLASPTDEQLFRMKKTNNVIDTKKIAIKLLEMKIKPSGSGSTYSLTAMPYNHTAFSQSAASMPVAMAIEAGTVGEFFSSTDDLVNLFATDLATNEERLEAELDKWIKENTLSLGSVNRTPSAAEIVQRRETLKNAIKYNSKSLTAAYNAYNDKISKDQKLSKLPPTKIAFNIPDKIIADSPIVNDATAQTSNAPINNQTSSYNSENPQLKKTEAFNINPGTSIIDVIDQVMGKSEYIKSQIKTQGKENNTQAEQTEYNNGKPARGEEKTSSAPLKWYKIIPTVALNGFDTSRNAYSKTILYSILPYSAVNAYHPNFPKTSTQNKAQSVVREYNYFYTGKNQDITRLDIDFDSTFYTQLTTYASQIARQGTNRTSDPNDDQNPETQFSVNTPPQQTNPPSAFQYTGSNKDSNSMNTATNPNEKVVADLKKSLYTSQRGDALNIKLQIIGDPDFIKQDDVFFNPGSPAEYAKLLDDRFPNLTAPISSSGQILFDAEQVNVRVQFKNAVDIDDTIGIVNKQDLLQNGRRTDGTFSGIYKVLQVESNFSRGQFTQTLDLIRIPEELPAISVAAPNTAQTGVSTTTQNVKLSENDESKRSVISANPAGVSPPVSPKLIEAAQQPAVNNQGAPENAGSAQNIAPQASSNLTFAEVFRQARKDFGNKPGGVFEWRGKLYQTNYQNEPYVNNPIPVYPGANQ